MSGDETLFGCEDASPGNDGMQRRMITAGAKKSERIVHPKTDLFFFEAMIPEHIGTRRSRSTISSLPPMPYMVLLLC